MLQICLDETGSDRHDCSTHYGYGLLGRPLISQRLSERELMSFQCMVFLTVRQ